MNQIIKALLGSQSGADFTANFILALLGAFIMILIQTTGRDVKSPRTPVSFSWKFFICDNARRFITSILLILAALRFTPEIFGMELSPFWAFVIGLINDRIAQAIKDKTQNFGKKITG